MTRWWQPQKSSASKERVREVEGLLGRKTMEVEILKEALKVAPNRNRSAVASPVPEMPIDESKTTPSASHARCSSSAGMTPGSNTGPPERPAMSNWLQQNPRLCRRAGRLWVPADAPRY